MTKRSRRKSLLAAVLSVILAAQLLTSCGTESEKEETAHESTAEAEAETSVNEETETIGDATEMNDKTEYIVSHDESDAANEPKTVLRRTAIPGYETVVTECTVMNFGAKCDGVTDDTKAFQKALDYVKKQGGGVVFVPAGEYRLDGGLEVYESCTLFGEWSAPDSANGAPVTVINAYGGKNKENGTPLFKTANGAAVIGLTVFYPEQDAASPVPYPVTMKATDGNGANNSGYATMKYCTLVNPYRGIDFGPDWNELGVVDHVYMTSLDRGIFIDMVTDINRIEHLYISADTYTAYKPDIDRDSLVKYMKENVTGIELRRSDWQFVAFSEIKNVATAFRFSKSANAGAVDSTNSQIYDLTVADCTVGIDFEYNRAFNLLTNVKIEADSECILMREAFSGTVSLNSGSLVSRNGDAVKAVRGSSGVVTLMDSALEAEKGNYALRTNGGGAEIENCRSEGGCEILLGEGTTGAVIRGDKSITVTSEIADAALITDGEYAPVSYISEVYENLRPTSPYVEANGFINLADTGADRTGKTDVTEKIVSALEELSKSGGILYIPAGRYLVNGTLTIPSGVEVRGVSMTGHHSNALGTALYSTNDMGNADGTPFITLSENSGVRGLTVWYPTQDVHEPVKYPYSISAEAHGVWVTDVTVGNGWRGLFLGENSGGHYVSYFSGFCFENDITVDGSDSMGYILNTHTNPHFYGRTPDTLDGGDPGDFTDLLGKAVGTKKASVVLGKTTDEVFANNFNYRGGVGLVIKDGFDGILIGCGYDGVGTGIDVRGTAGNIVNINFQSSIIPADQNYVRMSGGEMTFINSGFSAFNFNPQAGVTLSGGKAQFRQGVFEASPMGRGALHASSGDITLHCGVFNHVGPINADNTGFTEQGKNVTDVKAAGGSITVESALGKRGIKIKETSDEFAGTFE